MPKNNNFEPWGFGPANTDKDSFDPDIIVPAINVRIGGTLIDTGTVKNSDYITPDELTVEDLQDFLDEYGNEGQRATREFHYDRLETAEKDPEAYPADINVLRTMVERYKKYEQDIEFVEGLLEQRLQASATLDMSLENS